MSPAVSLKAVSLIQLNSVTNSYKAQTSRQQGALNGTLYTWKQSLGSSPAMLKLERAEASITEVGKDRGNPQRKAR